MSQTLPARIRENRSRLPAEPREFIRIPGISTLPAPNEKFRIGNYYSGILTVTRYLEKCEAA
jgi:hypothetical protein